MTIASRYESLPDPRSDTQLLIGARSGSEAFATFYRRNVDGIMSYFWKRTRDTHATADLTSETFAVAWQRIDKFDPSRGNAAQWLFGIARNLLKKFWRRNRATDKARRQLAINEVILIDEAAREIEIVDAKLDAERLGGAIDSLSARVREAVRLRIVENMSYDEIAAHLGCRNATARMRVLRGLRKLEERYGLSIDVEPNTVDPRTLDEAALDEAALTQMTRELPNAGTP